MRRLEVSGSVRPIYGSLGFKRLKTSKKLQHVSVYDHHQGVTMLEFFLDVFNKF